MPTATASHDRQSSAGPDDLDNLLDYDDAVEDFWKDMPEPNGDNANESNDVPEKDMDEEVKVAKKRKPNPKLDQDRLLSSAGIPKLRRIAKDKLKFKGKGHEFSDISRMLNLYQLWLDDLYPKAKFKDGLTMVEKLGHTKRMQVSRRAWIDESKSLRRREDEDVEMRLGDVAGQGEEENDEIFPILTRSKESVPGQEQSGGGADAPDEDELDALLGEEPAAAAPSNTAGNGPAKSQGPFQDDDDDEPDEDELDALLNEEPHPAVQPKQPTTKQRGPFEDDEDGYDELDALLAEEPQRTYVAGGASGYIGGAQQAKDVGKDADFADDEEAMAEMGW